ncbi:hypothetical protein [Desulfoluna sp.]|uniref:hypothetical protein n=1 Tax=Desulfoluna sp. TaxID=2045199 RepID=UPI00262E9B9E|nr:hypothetical protein [Desulfoluna sp.]
MMALFDDKSEPLVKGKISAVPEDHLVTVFDTGIVKRPEDYRWCSIGHHVQTGNRDGFLSLDFGLMEFGVKSAERLEKYREFLYHAGSVKKRGKAAIPARVFQSEKEKKFELDRSRRFRSRTRYFTDSGIIGSKALVIGTYEHFKNSLYGSRERIPRQIKGLDGMYSMKRLREA